MLMCIHGMIMIGIENSVVCIMTQHLYRVGESFMPLERMRQVISANMLRNIRTSRNLTEREMADEMKIPINQWIELEMGKKDMSPGTFNRLVTAFQISDDEVPSWKHMTVGNLGSKVRALRKKHQYSLEQLGTLMDMSPAYLSEVERGEKIPSFSTIRAIAEVFNIPISLFIGNKRKQSIVGEKLRHARKNLRMTQKDVAEAAGISPAMVAHLENGKIQASLDTIEKISELLGISVCYLILEQEEVDEMIGAITPEMRNILFDSKVQSIIGSICTFSKEEMVRVLNYIHLIRNPHVQD